jgi:Fungal specific transcription factor domain/Fungal Zn(2)-Cys(6) binuclear cluster domain
MPSRKRRRTPATGAANDCFTCASRNVSCDRKRPYCSPCLEQGKDCAGYKTTLTWGVGVASRGKLRGLSLPIASSKQKPLPRLRKPSYKRDSTVGRRLQNSGTVSGPPESFSTLPILPHDHKPVLEETTIKLQSVPPDVYISMASQLRFDQNPTSYRASPDSTHEEPPLSTKSDQIVFPTSIGTLERYKDRGFGRLAGSVAPSEATSYIRTIQSHRKARSHSMNAASSVQRHDAESWSAHVYHDKNLGQSRSDDVPPSRISRSLPTTDQRQLDSAQIGPAWLQTAKKLGGGEGAEEQDLADADLKVEAPDASSRGGSLNHNAPILSPFSGLPMIGKTPRMQYLINYYAEVISPVIVAFDGPTNPYRSYILRMASESETLQHAISALSASNLRQRRESGELSTGKTDPARRSSLAHLTLTDKAWQSAHGFLSVEDQRKEENYHKNATVHLIQRQFADPSQHKDDSVLATLLIVCLFHICESGVAKFRTHFAGAKKLLGMRENSGILRSKEAKWFTRMFTWFDAMTATVNDREGQMQEGLLDLSCLSDEEWALENLAGCDGKLFRIIAKLGRLNILSQKGMADSAPVTGSCGAPIVSPRFPHWDAFGSHAWATSEAHVRLQTSHDLYPDMRTQYGREWHDTRNSLLSWTLDASLFGSGNPGLPALTQDQQLDLLNISESFRFSAMIYMERLALTSVPSSDPRIQSWVQGALHYIELVRSDVYLLWPLFVTGSECVSEIDRHIIRQRCLDIQKDSGFSNNASCLKLLEEIWASNPSASGTLNLPHGFRWRSVMKPNVPGGEYIVV